LSSSTPSNPDDEIHLDRERAERTGMPEIIYGESKSVEQLQAILRQLEGETALVTRLQADKAAQLRGDYDPVARCLLFGEQNADASNSADPLGPVGIVSAGTSDAPVAREALLTLQHLGVEARLIQDVGVAGLHRLLGRLPELSDCKVFICVAGFEGALPSVLTGLVKQPVIGVPTSVGYGVSVGGQAALSSMLASCAGGLLVVNIDNGCGAALAAARILKGGLWPE